MTAYANNNPSAPFGFYTGSTWLWPILEYSGTYPIIISGSLISIAASTSGSPGSMSAADKTKLDYLTLASATSITGGGTLALAGYTLTVTGTASVKGTNTGDQTNTAVTPISVAGTGGSQISHNTSGVSAGTYNRMVVDAWGHITSGSDIAYLTSISGSAVMSNTTGSTVKHNTSGIVAGTFAYPSSITFDAYGHASAVTAGTAPAMFLIADTILSGSALSITFSSIPGTYKHLRLVLSGRTPGTGDNPVLQFNGDTGNNYDNQYFYATSTTVAAGLFSATYRPTAGTIPGSSQRANCISVTDIIISDYINTYREKSAYCASGYADVTIPLFWNSTISWHNTAAINQITISTYTGLGFSQYTRATLYGY